MRNLHDRIDAMNTHYIEMVKNVNRLMRINLEILKNKSLDKTLYGEAKVVEEKINTYEVKMKEDAIVTIAMFQPAASDLRSLLSMLEGSKILERMGDLFLSDIKLVKKMEKMGEGHIEHLHLLEVMVKKITELFDVYIRALVERDERKVYTLLTLDEDVNDLRDINVEKIIEIMKESPENVEFGNLILLATKKYERISDKIMQLGRGLIYNINGENLRKQELIERKR